jgi:hypothetical protein
MCPLCCTRWLMSANPNRTACILRPLPNASGTSPEDLTFRKHKFTDKPTVKVENKPKPDVNMASIKPVDQDRFRAKLAKTAPHAAWLLCTAPKVTAPPVQTEPITCTVLPQLHNVDFMYADSVDLTDDKCTDNFKKHFNSLTCTADDCRLIEAETRGQTKNTNWMTARKGRITSSNF